MKFPRWPFGRTAPPEYPTEHIPTHRLFPAWEKLLRILAVVAVLALPLGGYLAWRSRQPKPDGFPATRSLTADSGWTTTPALSPDGRFAAYASDRDAPGPLALWLHDLKTSESRKIAGSASEPDFSPDSQTLVYRSEENGGEIRIGSTTGSAVRTLVPSGHGPRFSPDGRAVAYFTTGTPSSRFSGGSLHVVPAEGGEPLRLQPDFAFARHPVWVSPRQILFEGVDTSGIGDWWVTGLDAGPAVRTHALAAIRPVAARRGPPSAWHEGRILFSAAEESFDRIWELPLDTGSWQPSGPVHQLTNGFSRETAPRTGPDRTLAFTRSSQIVEIYSLALDPDTGEPGGDLTPETTDGVAAILPALSGNGSRLAYLSNVTGLSDLWLKDMRSGTTEKLSSFRAVGHRPMLSFNGRLLAFPTSGEGECLIGIADLANPDNQTFLQGCFGLWDWSPGGFLVFDPLAARKSVGLLRRQSSSPIPILARDDTSVYAARLSPDGKRIAFTAGPSGSDAQVYIAPYSEGLIPQSRWVKVPGAEGGQPAWSPDGRILYSKSLRDGHECIWGFRQDGVPFPVLHFHEAAFSPGRLHTSEFQMAVGGGRLVLNVARDRANVYLTTIRKE